MLTAREAYELAMKTFEEKYQSKLDKAKERLDKKIKAVCKDARTSIQCRLHKNARVCEILRRHLQSNLYQVTDIPNSSEVKIVWSHIY